MHHRSFVALAATAATLGLAGPAAAQSTGTAFAVDTAGQLLTSPIGSPKDATAATITGLPAGSGIVGIDERPRTGQLYAVVKAADGTGSAYTIDPATAQATLAFALVNAATKAPIVLTGDAQGVDFNPAADALRIIGDDGQNLRALPSNRVAAGVQRTAGDTFVDGTLSYAPLGSMPRPAATGVSEAAYTQNLPVTSTTTLLDIDGSQDDLVLQSPPNDGTLSKRADLGSEGRTVNGFDIATAGTTDTGYVVIGGPKPGQSSGSRSQLAVIDLATGVLTAVGNYRSSSVVDVAIDTP